jgi:hypothetical protein
LNPFHEFTLAVPVLLVDFVDVLVRERAFIQVEGSGHVDFDHSNLGVALILD